MGAARRGSRPARPRRRARSSRGSTPTGGRRWFSRYLGDVEETALVFIDGAYSHALHRRVPLPAAGDREVFYLDEELRPAQAGEQERAVAEAALAAAPGELLYGRVDLVDGVVLELEVAEPSLYLAFGPGAAERFARAIVGCLDRGSL